MYDYFASNNSHATNTELYIFVCEIEGRKKESSSMFHMLRRIIMGERGQETDCIKCDFELKRSLKEVPSILI